MASTTAQFYASYMKIEHPVVQQVRREAFGEDIGQFSWTSAEEGRRFYALLGLGEDSRVLDFCWQEGRRCSWPAPQGAA
jgi:hypothetical protein